MTVVSCCEHPAPVHWLLLGPVGVSLACERCRRDRTRALRRHFEELTWRVAKPWLIRPKSPIVLGLLLLAFVLTGYGAGTEQFIPIGQSPGVSGTVSLVGRLTLADPRTKRVCVSGAERDQCTMYSHAMAVYLDRSHLKQPNTIGGWADLVVGRTVEVYEHKWIKVRMEETHP